MNDKKIYIEDLTNLERKTLMQLCVQLYWERDLLEKMLEKSNELVTMLIDKI